MEKPVHFTAPSQWGLASVGLFFEGEDLSEHETPFAASMMVQLRMDVQNATDTAVRAKDLATAQQRIPQLHVIGAGPLKVPNAGELEHLEWMFPDPAIQAVHQLIIYVRRGTRLYTVTATHQHDRFEAIRAAVLEVAAGLLKDPKVSAR